MGPVVSDQRLKRIPAAALAARAADSEQAYAGGDFAQSADVTHSFMYRAADVYVKSHNANRVMLPTVESPVYLKVTIGATVVHRMKLISLVVLASVSGCAPYDPLMQGDHASQRYKEDLEQCRTSSREAVRLKNASTLQSWVISPVTGPPAVRAAIRKCMQGKGYALKKAGT